MKTIELYEKSGTTELQNLLKKYERVSEHNEILMDIAKAENRDFGNLNKLNNDYEIDIILLRRELNRRLWAEK
jgi:hypothetical protein